MKLKTKTDGHGFFINNPSVSLQMANSLNYNSIRRDPTRGYLTSRYTKKLVESHYVTLKIQEVLYFHDSCIDSDVKWNK